MAVSWRSPLLVSQATIMQHHSTRIQSPTNPNHSRLFPDADERICLRSRRRLTGASTNHLERVAAGNSTEARHSTQSPSNILQTIGFSAFQLKHWKIARVRTFEASAEQRRSRNGLRGSRTMAAEGSQSADEVVKLATVETADGISSVGMVRGSTFWPFQNLSGLSDEKTLPIKDMTDVIRNWDILHSRLEQETFEREGLSLSNVKLLAPIPRPSGTIMCIGKNYLDHVKEVDTWKSAPGITLPEAPKHPIVFTKAPQSVVGPEAIIRYPQGVSSQVDYEAELAVIVGTGGRGIKKEEAMNHVFGYTILNDITARDLQKNHQQWFLGKSCDTFCPMGPWIVPASDIDGRDLEIQCWINDELRQDGRTSQMIFSIPELIETISAAITLQPGDIIATGTPAGVGSGFNPPRHLVPGDRIRIQIEGIGELKNVVG